MEPFASGPHSYIVRVWLEEAGDGRRRYLLRGRICRVVIDGEPAERHFTSLDDIPVFIREHLEELGVSDGRRRSGWLARLRRKGRRDEGR